MKRALLIIGHSPKKQGAYNKTHDITEFSINERIVLDLAEQIKLFCEPVVVYRDVTYGELPNKVNKIGGDVAISFHCNAFNKKAKGHEVLYYHKSKKGKEYASLLNSKLAKNIGHLTVDRGIKPKTSSDRGGHILKKTAMPCILVESFFMDNDKEIESLYLDPRGYDFLTQGLYMGINKIINN